MLKVLVAIDGSQHSDRVVHALIALHEKVQLEIHLLNVQMPVTSGHVRMFVGKSDLDSYYQEEGSKALESARKLLAQSNVPYTEHLAVGHVAETIAKFTESTQVDQIMMGTQGRSALADLLLGTVVSDVIKLTDLPVTLVK